MDSLVALGLVLVVGLVGGLLSRRLNLPSITGYVVVGLILGPTVSGIIDVDTAESLNVITSVCLGVIAYLIGTSLRTKTLRKLGKSITWITLLEAIGAFVTVAVVLALVSERLMPGYTMRETYIPFALVMAATAAATAPAAVLAIVREYRAKGPLTSTLLAVVALDDAIAVILFAGSIAVSGLLAGTAAEGSMVMVAVKPVLEIFVSIGVGCALGFSAVRLSKFLHSRGLYLVLVLGAVVLCYGVSDMVGASGIMANMAFGFIVGNRKDAGSMAVAVEDIESVLYTLFFVVAGLHFDTGAFSTAAPLAVIIVVVRCGGKYLGTRLGAWIGGAEKQVGEYLGLALLPQAGVSIGLALIAATSFPELAAPMVSATLASVIINELITPPLARSALVRAGEARLETQKEEAAVSTETTAPAADSAGSKETRRGDYVPIGVVADRTRNPYVLESPWTRSQRARSSSPRNRRAGPPDSRSHL